VSHELRTPLARLLALLDSASLPSTDTQELIERAKHEVEAMAELVDDVLFLSELETGRAVVGLGDVLLAPIVRDVVEALRPSAERQAQEVVMLVAEDAAVAVRPWMLRVVVENLLVNAIRYVPSGGRVEVGIAPGPGRTYRLTVSDDGPGIPAAELPLLFGRFYRGSGRRPTEPGSDAGGSGLGLAIVREIVERHGGSARAESRSPRGLAITIEVPALSRA